MTKSKSKEKPIWLKYSIEEIKKIVLDLSKKGLTGEKIGLILRDQYGIPKVRLYGLKMKDLLWKDFKEPTITNLEKKVNKLNEHVGKNKGDKKSKRSLIITKAKFKKREEYHNRSK